MQTAFNSAEDVDDDYDIFLLCSTQNQTFKEHFTGNKVNKDIPNEKPMQYAA